MEESIVDEQRRVVGEDLLYRLADMSVVEHVCHGRNAEMYRAESNQDRCLRFYG